MCNAVQQKVSMVLFPSSKFPNLTCMRVCSLSHTVYACSKPDLGWCHVQLLRGWQTVSAPQHGALWSACQADWQVNDTNESQPSLPLGARHWVTASKQPERVSLNLKVISLTHSLSLSLHYSLALSPSSWPPLPFSSLWLPLVFSPSFQTSRSLSFSSSIHGYFFTSTEGLCFFSLSLLLPSLSPFHSVCHRSVLFSITVSQSLKEQLDCLSVLPLSQNLGWKVFENWVKIGARLCEKDICLCVCVCVSTSSCTTQIQETSWQTLPGEILLEHHIFETLHG